MAENDTEETAAEEAAAVITPDAVEDGGATLQHVIDTVHTEASRIIDALTPAATESHEETAAESHEESHDEPAEMPGDGETIPDHSPASLPWTHRRFGRR